MNIRPNSIEARDIANVLHPYTNAATHEKVGPLVIERGDGIYVIDNAGNRYHRRIGRPCSAHRWFQRAAPGRGRLSANEAVALLS